MSFASKHNKSRAKFGVDTKGFTFVKLSEIYLDPLAGGSDVIHPINGLYIHTSPLAVCPVLIDAESRVLVNLPSYMVDDVRNILSDSESVDDIRNGKVGYIIYEYVSHNKKCYGIHFVDR